VLRLALASLMALAASAPQIVARRGGLLLRRGVDRSVLVSR